MPDDVPRPDRPATEPSASPTAAPSPADTVAADAAPVDTAPVDTAPADDGQRLHPLTLIQRLVLSLPALVILLLPLLRGGDQQSWFALAMAIMYAVLALPMIFLRYFRFRYRITPREVVIRSGVLTVRNRSIPIERIQNIEIEQSLLPRLLGTAKVTIETAGSSSAEGVLEYVGLDEARSIRQVIRSFQQRARVATPAAPSEPEAATDFNEPALGTEAASSAADDPAAAPVAEAPPLFAMPLSRVLLSGVFRFSLLYIALIFSGLQYLNLDPEDVVDWFTRQEMDAVTETVSASPYLAAFIAVFIAALLSWLTGILVNLNKYYRFRLWLEDDKLHKHHGLLTVSEGTIPLQRVQALILRSNPLMEWFGWTALQLQTMGYEVDKQGHQMAAPFVQKHTLADFAPHIYPFTLPERFHRVSPLTIRRAFVRYTVGLLVVIGPLTYWWTEALWGLVLLPLLLYFAILHYRHLGFAVEDGILFVRRGVVRRYTWVIPVEKFQVFYLSASIFQRRLGLKSLLVDTAGAGSFAVPEIVDLPASRAEELLHGLHARFNRHFARSTSEAQEEATASPAAETYSAPSPPSGPSESGRPGFAPEAGA